MSSRIAGFHRANARLLQRLVANQKLRVFFRENVVRHDRDVVRRAQKTAELQHQRRLSAADGAADPDRERALLVVALFQRLAFAEQPRMRPVLMRMRVPVRMSG
jgi:hypothetical protein